MADRSSLRTGLVRATVIVSLGAMVFVTAACGSGSNTAESAGAGEPATTQQTDAGPTGASEAGTPTDSVTVAPPTTDASGTDASGTDASGTDASGTDASADGSTGASDQATTDRPTAGTSSAGTATSNTSSTTTASASGTSTGATAGTSTSAASSTASATATTATSTAPVLLKSGSSGPEVTALQNKLNHLGYWNGEADGTYGELTAQAVMAYQKAAGIDADGVAGPQTQQAIDRNVQPSIRTTSGDAIEVDLQAQLVKVVENGSLKYVFNTSTGSGETYLQKDVPEPQVAITPTGKFAIERSIDGMRTSKLGKLWRPRYFYEGYALHGASYVPNYPASHGCVRLANEVIDFVWSQDLAPIGRTVWVY